MRPAVGIRPAGRLAQALAERMNALDVTIKDASARCGLTYEHVRKLVKGEAYPSPLALREICGVLQLDVAEMERLAVADRLEKKYGGIPHALAGHHPELSLLARWWDMLTEEQKASFRVQIRSVAEANQRLAAVRRPVRSTPADITGQKQRRR